MTRARERRSIRLKGYDYSRAGAYFVTICSQNRECLFGEIADGEMVLNGVGRVVKAVWCDLPNHFHGIIVLSDNVGAGFKPAPTNKKRHGLPEIIRGFKTFSSRRINEMRRTPGVKLWQRNYYERIIRDENEWNRIREYVVGNPVRWDMDRENPSHGRVHGPMQGRV